MLQLAIVVSAVAAAVLAEGFTFTIGNPVASQDFRAKGAAFVLREEGCADPAKSQISATAEGLLKGERKSLTLQVMAMPKPGIYAVYQGLARGRRLDRESQGNVRGCQGRGPCPDRAERFHQRGVEVFSPSGDGRGN